jgi:hypothetical protein
MRYLREYLDFSDIDNFDDGCVVLLFGSTGMNYLGVIDGNNNVKIVGVPSIFILSVIDNIDRDNGLFIDNNNILDLDKIDIRELISNLVIVGEDISVDELLDNLDDYKCSDGGIINRIKKLLKEYLNK